MPRAVASLGWIQRRPGGFSRSSSGAGMLAGPRNPNHESGRVNPVSVSVVVGMSGNCAARPRVTPEPDRIVGSGVPKARLGRDLVRQELGL